MMKSLALGLVLASSLALGQDDFVTAKVVDISTGSQLQAQGAFGLGNANTNAITVEMNGMRYTASFNTLTPGGKNSASQFVVGSEVQARVHEDRQLWIIRADGGTLKVRISRREIVQPDP